jgi:hypothetical protein
MGGENEGARGPFVAGCEFDTGETLYALKNLVAIVKVHDVKLCGSLCGRNTLARLQP